MRKPQAKAGRTEQDRCESATNRSATRGRLDIAGAWIDQQDAHEPATRAFANQSLPRDRGKKLSGEQHHT